MSIESPNTPPSKIENSSVAEEGVRFNLPGILGFLPPPERERFDDLMMSVIPWRGDGYTLGLNGLFKFVPMDVVSQVTAYVNEQPENSSGISREELVDKLRIVFADHRFNEMSNEQLRSFS